MRRKTILLLTLGLFVLSCNVEVSEKTTFRVVGVKQYAHESGNAKDYYHVNNLATYRIEADNPRGIGGDESFNMVDSFGKFKIGDEVEFIIRLKTEAPKVPIQVEKTKEGHD